MAPKHFARLATLLLVLASPVTASDYFTITVRDDATGNPIPGIRLSTINNIIYTNDLLAGMKPGDAFIVFMNDCMNGRDWDRTR